MNFTSQTMEDLKFFVPLQSARFHIVTYIE